MNQTLTLGRSSGLNRDTRLVFELLGKISGGLLEIRLPDGSCALFGDGEHGVSMQVHDEVVFAQIIARGDIGLAEAYLDGAWDSPDITGLLGLLARNRDVLKKAVYGSWRGLVAARVPALAEPQQQGRQQAQHHGALRSRQRFLQALARPEHELFERAVPRRRWW